MKRSFGRMNILRHCGRNRWLSLTNNIEQLSPRLIAFRALERILRMSLN
jgi:hypothetical protein